MVVCGMMAHISQICLDYICIDSIHSIISSGTFPNLYPYLAASSDYDVLLRTSQLRHIRLQSSTAKPEESHVSRHEYVGTSAYYLSLLVFKTLPKLTHGRNGHLRTNAYMCMYYAQAPGRIRMEIQTLKLSKSYSSSPCMQSFDHRF